jgi:hypothetical protein
MAVNIKAIKAELLEAAAGEKPPASFVNSEGILDMFLKDYFNPASRAPKDLALNAIAASVSVAKAGRDGNPLEFTDKQVKAILDKYKP